MTPNKTKWKQHTWISNEEAGFLSKANRGKKTWNYYLFVLEWYVLEKSLIHVTICDVDKPEQSPE